MAEIKIKTKKYKAEKNISGWSITSEILEEHGLPNTGNYQEKLLDFIKKKNNSQKSIYNKNEIIEIPDGREAVLATIFSKVTLNSEGKLKIEPVTIDFIEIVQGMKNATVKISGKAERVKEKVKHKYEKQLSLGKKLLEVKWSGIFEDEGLTADWRFLWFVWYYELSPKELGQWIDDSTCIITRDDYINDLKSRDHYRKSIELFKKQYSKFSDIEIGDHLTEPKNNSSKGYLWVFTGPGTTTGKYTALEWFLGSYKLYIEVKKINRSAKSLVVEMKVKNKSHWQSGTRTPKVAQEAGFKKHLVSNAKRSEFGPGGDFHQEFIWIDEIQY